MTRAGGPVAFEDPDRVADAIIERVGKTIELALPLGLGKANHVANALFKRAAADPTINLRIFTALTLEKPRSKSDLERRFLEPVVDRVFAGYPELAYALALHAGTLPPNVKVDEFFFEAGTRLGIAAAQQSYICANYTHALRYVLDRGVNVVAQLVAKRERAGETRFSLSCNPDLTLDLLACRARKACDFLFVGEVNSELPFMPGDGDIAAGEFDLMLESPATDFRLFAPPREPIDLADYAAGLHVARTVADGGTLQLGIGSLGDAVAHALILRHRRNADFRALAARVSGVGGQYNFVAQSFALEAARSIILLRATRTARRRTTSNISWNYGHTTIPRHLRDIVVTEYGIADLRGKSDRDVIAAMLAVADSRFQDELLRRARDAGKIEQSFELPAACRDNTPERIAGALAPAREAGLLPPFPFGSDFTAIEQRLIPALKLLRAASLLHLARLLARGFFASAPSGEPRDCLARMGLDHPSGATARVEAALLKAALEAPR